MQLENKVGIIVVTYNCPQIFLKQVNSIEKKCKDNFEIVIIDNSTDESAIESIKYHSERRGLRYFKTRSTSRMGSDSHAFAANFSYQKLKDEYDYFFYIDHDCFAVEDFSVIEILGDKTFAGIAQVKKKALYLWPGCLMFKKTDGVDFSTNHELGLDTGGNLYKLLNEANTKYFNEEHVQNPGFNKSFYNFYSSINNGMFLHFIAASNWSNTESNEERINSLINIVDAKISGRIFP